MTKQLKRPEVLSPAGTLEKLKVAKGFDDQLTEELTKLINDYKDIFLTGRI